MDRHVLSDAHDGVISAPDVNTLIWLRKVQSISVMSIQDVGRVMSFLEDDNVLDLVDVVGVNPDQDVLRDGIIQGSFLLWWDLGAGDADIIDVELVGLWQGVVAGTEPECDPRSNDVNRIICSVALAGWVCWRV